MTLARALGLLLIIAGPAFAQDASERFRLATRLYGQGNVTEAMTELTALSKTAPSGPVWMNLAVIHAEQGRPAEAVDAADHALAAPQGLTEKQRERLGVIRGLELQKTGELAIASPVDGTELWLDGTSLGKTPLAQPIRVAAGIAFLVALAPKHEPVAKQLTITAEQRSELALELTPTELAPATVRLETALPGANVYVDDQLVGITPKTKSVVVLPGTRKISVRRDGYLDGEQLITVEAGATVVAKLEPVARQNAPTGQALVVSSEGNVDLTLDGERRGIVFDEKAVDLVGGPHRLLLERSGFLSIDREVTVVPSKTTRVELLFEPTAERRASLASGRKVQRVLGYVGIGVGAAGIIASSILAFGWYPYLDRYWKKQIDLADAELRANKGCAVTMNPAWLTCDQITSLSNDKRKEIARDQSFALIGLAVSAGAVGAGVLSYLLAPELTRYERPLKNPDFIPELGVTVLPGGAAVSAAGRF